MATTRRLRSQGHGGQDPHLPFLTVAEANRVRLLVRQAFAKQGREVIVYGDYARDDQGAEFGLWNVAAACHAQPWDEEWARVVDRHAKIVLAHVDSGGVESLGSDEIRSRIYPQLWLAAEIAVVPNQTGLSYLSEQVPGLLELLVVDFDDAAVTLADSQVLRFGGLATLRAAGLANVRNLPSDEVRQVTALDGGTFDLLLGRSPYTASKVLVMADLLAQIYGRVDDRYGVLVATPARDRVALHVISSRAFTPSLHLMAQFALASVSDAIGPLSPNVFWWHEGEWTQVTQAGADNTFRLRPSPAFAQIVQQLNEQ